MFHVSSANIYKNPPQKLCAKKRNLPFVNKIRYFATKKTFFQLIFANIFFSYKYIRADGFLSGNNRTKPLGVFPSFYELISRSYKCYDSNMADGILQKRNHLQQIRENLNNNKESNFEEIENKESWEKKLSFISLGENFFISRLFSTISISMQNEALVARVFAYGRTNRNLLLHQRTDAFTNYCFRLGHSITVSIHDYQYSDQNA